MAKRMAMQVCERCGRSFRLCRFNKHSQKYCTDEHCRLERKRERQRKDYRNKYQRDAEFRAAERERAKINIAQRRAQVQVSGVPSEPLSINHACVTAGLLAHVLDIEDPAQFRDSIRVLERRGQALPITSLLAENAEKSAHAGMFLDTRSGKEMMLLDTRSGRKSRGSSPSMAPCRGSPESMA